MAGNKRLQQCQLPWPSWERLELGFRCLFCTSSGEYDLPYRLHLADLEATSLSVVKDALITVNGYNKSAEAIMPFLDNALRGFDWRPTNLCGADEWVHRRAPTFLF